MMEFDNSVLIRSSCGRVRTLNVISKELWDSIGPERQRKLRQHVNEQTAKAAAIASDGQAREQAMCCLDEFQWNGQGNP